MFKEFFTNRDETLCSAYLNMTKDPIVGVNQKMEIYWIRISKFYNENKKTENARSLLSL
jgi:hypothetical protein